MWIWEPILGKMPVAPRDYAKTAYAEAKIGLFVQLAVEPWPRLALEGEVCTGMKNAFGKLTLLTLAVLAVAASPASASGPQLSGSVSRIGSTTPAAYAVTVTNTGETTEGVVLFEFPGSETPAAGGLVPSSCTFNQPVAGTIGCPAIKAGETLKLCYVGPAVDHVTVFFGAGERFPLSSGGGVSSCPVPGFVLPGEEKGGGGSTPAGVLLAIGKVTDHPSVGTATLKLKVSGPGTVKLSGSGVKGATAKAKAAGAVSLTVKAKGSAMAKLNEKGKVTLHLKITFTPSGGSATTLKKNLTLTKEH
ncbi:MAG TPA: hypothetical protein VMT37_02180 [Solirubrobacterales bacterium]|nr:hypothetical protein [Solirubrobacterales bacterium]